MRFGLVAFEAPLMLATTTALGEPTMASQRLAAVIPNSGVEDAS